MRRPTINFSEWKFSVDLKETRAIQNQKGLPAFGCDCEDCSAWRKYHARSLPQELIESFNRIGINLNHPSDCYGSHACLRVIFHFVGAIQSGPDSTINNEKIDSHMMNNVTVQKKPWVSIMVLPSRKSFESRPTRANGTDRGVICIDMRLELNKS